MGVGSPTIRPLRASTTSGGMFFLGGTFCRGTFDPTPNKEEACTWYAPCVYVERGKSIRRHFDDHLRH
jgi:hypothetical protein